MLCLLLRLPSTPLKGSPRVGGRGADCQQLPSHLPALLAGWLAGRPQVALTERFSERWAAAGQRTRAYAMHPGWTETEGVKTSIPGFYATFKNKLRNLQQGCDTTVWLCLEVRCRR